MNTTVRGHLALCGRCPLCGTMQAEHVVTDQYVFDGGTLSFTCMKCGAKFEVNWPGVDLSGDTHLGFIGT